MEPIVKKTFAYTRVETESDITIVYNTWNIYAVFGSLIIFFVGLIESIYPLSIVGGIISISLYVSNVSSVSSVNNEVKGAMSKGKATVTGGKYSFNRPVTVIITKDN